MDNEEQGESDTPSSNDENQDTILIAPDQFGDIKPKEGDKLTFCVEGIDSEGNVSGYFESGDGKEESGDSMENWKAGLRAEMSPRNSTEEEQ